MRKLFLILIVLSAGSVFGQEEKSTEARTEFLNEKNWSVLGKPVEGTNGFTHFSRNIQPKTEGIYQLWVKIVPSNQAAFNRRYNLPKTSAFSIQQATVDCGRKQVLTEKTSVFDAGNNSLNAGSSDLIQKSSRNRVKPGSINDTIFAYICVKL
ncbi:MAG: hypothetical protein ACT4O9_11410 [Blastocatellia bacterium]